MSNRKTIQKGITIPDLTSEVFSLRFSNDSSLLAAGCGDGTIRVWSSSTAAPLYDLLPPLSTGTTSFTKFTNLPITSIRFRPNSALSNTKNVLLATSSDGSIYHFHVTSQKLLHKLSNVSGDSNTGRDYGGSGIGRGSGSNVGSGGGGGGLENEVFCVDYRHDGERFATAGKDRVIRVFDEATKSLVCSMSAGTPGVTPGHSNRVFSLKFCGAAFPTVIVTGGWDKTVQIWDERQHRAVRSIFGPNICGDSVDMHNNTILTGSWRQSDQIQLWDFGSCKLIDTIPWEYEGDENREQKTYKIERNSEKCMVYCAEFSKDGRFIAAGGSGNNECRVFDRFSKEVVGTTGNVGKAVFSLNFDQNGRRIALGGGEKLIRILDILDRSQVNTKFALDDSVKNYQNFSSETELKSESKTESRMGKKRKSSNALLSPTEQKLRDSIITN